jgi:hypothetical protein
LESFRTISRHSQYTLIREKLIKLSQGNYSAEYISNELNEFENISRSGLYRAEKIDKSYNKFGKSSSFEQRNSSP